MKIQVRFFAQRREKSYRLRKYTNALVVDFDGVVNEATKERNRTKQQEEQQQRSQQLNNQQRRMGVNNDVNAVVLPTTEFWRHKAGGAA